MVRNKPMSLFNVNFDGMNIPLNDKMVNFLSEFKEFVIVEVIDRKNNGKYIGIFPKSYFYSYIKDEGLKLSSSIIDYKYCGEIFLILSKQMFIDCGINKKITVVYSRDCIKIWNPTLYDNYCKILREKYGDVWNKLEFS